MLRRLWEHCSRRKVAGSAAMFDQRLQCGIYDEDRQHDPVNPSITLSDEALLFIQSSETRVFSKSENQRSDNDIMGSLATPLSRRCLAC